MTTNSCDREILGRNGRTVSGASAIPMKMFAAAQVDSMRDAPVITRSAPPRKWMISDITRR